MRSLALWMLCACLCAETGTHTFLREIKLDKNSGLTAPAVTPGTQLDDKLVETLTQTETELLKQDSYRDAKVKPERIPAGAEQVDLHLHSTPGTRYTVNEVRFTGNLGEPEADLARALRAVRSHRVWRVLWIAHPPYSDSGVADDLDRLQSFYYSRGYFDAKTSLDNAALNGNQATLTFRVDSGPKYKLETPIAETCRCVLDARRQAEREGKIDFKAQLALPSGIPQFQPGDRYRVGRIEFSGNHRFRDTDVRRALVLDEGELFDGQRLRNSLARINQLGFFETVSMDNVQISRHPELQTADVSITVKERKPGRWSISGPVGPPSFAGPLEGTISRRLPIPTWFVSATWIAFDPLAKFLPFSIGNGWVPLFSIGRPLLPGSVWTTGLTISPQLGWQGMVASYVMAHAVYGAKLALHINRIRENELAIPVEGRQGYLICGPKKSHFAWARTAAGMGLDWVGQSYLGVQ
jgi:hypothetical protein